MGFFEDLFDWVLGDIILETDEFVDILRKIIAHMYGLATIMGLAMFYYAWRASLDTPEKGALVGITITLGVFGWVMCLPTVIYCRRTKSAPDWLMQYCLILAAIITIAWDVIMTFFPVRSTNLAIALMTIGSRIPGALILVGILCAHYIFVEVRDSFALPLRVPGAYEGSDVEKFLFAQVGVMAMTLCPAMLAGMLHEYIRLVEGAKANVLLAKDVSSLLLRYDTDGVRDVLEEATLESGGAVSKDLVETFTSIASNLDVYRPHLPSYVLPHEGSDSESDNDWTRRSGSRSSNSQRSQRSSSTDRRSSDRHSKYSSFSSHSGSVVELKDKYVTHKQRNTSGEFNRDNDSLRTANSDSTRAPTPTTAAASGGGCGGAAAAAAAGSGAAAAGGGPQRPGMSFLVGQTVQRVVLAQINLGKFSAVALFGLDEMPEQTTGKVNRVIELLLSNAADNEASVHSMVGDTITLSWNAATRSYSNEMKCCKFLLGLRPGVLRAMGVTSTPAGTKAAINMSGSAKAFQQSSSTAAPTAPPSADASPGDLQAEASVASTSRPSDVVYEQAARTVSAAAIVGSAWCQIGGNARRQQFMLSHFSHKRMLAFAARFSDDHDLIVVCRHMQSSAEHEYNLRGCAVVPFPASSFPASNETPNQSCSMSAGLMSPLTPKRELRSNSWSLYDDCSSSSTLVPSRAQLNPDVAAPAEPPLTVTVADGSIIPSNSKSTSGRGDVVTAVDGGSKSGSGGSGGSISGGGTSTAPSDQSAETLPHFMQPSSDKLTSGGISGATPALSGDLTCGGNTMSSGRTDDIDAGVQRPQPLVQLDSHRSTDDGCTTPTVSGGSLMSAAQAANGGRIGMPLYELDSARNIGTDDEWLYLVGQGTTAEDSGGDATKVDKSPAAVNARLTKIVHELCLGKIQRASDLLAGLKHDIPGAFELTAFRCVERSVAKLVRKYTYG